MKALLIAVFTVLLLGCGPSKEERIAAREVREEEKKIEQKEKFQGFLEREWGKYWVDRTIVYRKEIGTRNLCLARSETEHNMVVSDRNFLNLLITIKDYGDDYEKARGFLSGIRWNLQNNRFALCHRIIDSYDAWLKSKYPTTWQQHSDWPKTEEWIATGLADQFIRDIDAMADRARKSAGR